MAETMEQYLCRITGIDAEVRITRDRAMERAIANASYMTEQRHRSKAERRELAMEKLAKSFEPVHAAVQAAWENRP